MGRILEALGKFLEEDDWPYSLVESHMMYRTGFEGKNGQFTCFAQERFNQDQIVFYSVFPVRVPADMIGVAVEFITRANSGMIIGNFELDYKDGEIRYKTSVDVEEVDIIEDLLRPLIYANVVTMDKYSPGLMRVIHGAIDPATAIFEIENRRSV